MQVQPVSSSFTTTGEARSSLAAPPPTATTTTDAYHLALAIAKRLPTRDGETWLCDVVDALDDDDDGHHDRHHHIHRRLLTEYWIHVLTEARRSVAVVRDGGIPRVATRAQTAAYIGVLFSAVVPSLVMMNPVVRDLWFDSAEPSALHWTTLRRACAAHWHRLGVGPDVEDLARTWWSDYSHWLVRRPRRSDDDDDDDDDLDRRVTWCCTCTCVVSNRYMANSNTCEACILP